MSILLFAVGLDAQQVKSVKVTELHQTIKETKGPLIVNFWATFCVPCIEEMPYFQQLVNEYREKNVSLIFVSLDLKKDYPNKVNEMAKRLKLTFPVMWLNETNADYFCPVIDSTWTGGMPSSLFVNNAAGYHKFIEEQLSREKLQTEILAMLGPK